MRKGNLKINLKKSQFCLSEINFLGRTIYKTGTGADPDKVEATKSYPTYTHKSNTSIGAVLTQKENNDVEGVLAYASQTLNQAETNYNATVEYSSL